MKSKQISRVIINYNRFVLPDYFSSHVSVVNNETIQNNKMDFESPDVMKDFPGLYSTEGNKKNNDSDCEYIKTPVEILNRL